MKKELNRISYFIHDGQQNVGTEICFKYFRATSKLNDLAR